MALHRDSIAIIDRATRTIGYIVAGVAAAHVTFLFLLILAKVTH